MRVRIVDNLGFSLVEALIGMGLMAAVGIGVMQLQNSQVKNKKSQEASYEARIVVGVIQDQLSNKDACEATFGGMNFANNDRAYFGEVFSSPANTLFRSTMVNPNNAPELYEGKNTTELFRFSVQAQGRTDDEDGITENVDLRVGVDFRKVSRILNNQSLYTSFLAFPIRIKVLKSDGSFQECSSVAADALATSLDAFCRSLNGVLNSSDPNAPVCTLGGKGYPTPGIVDSASHQGVSLEAFAQGLWPNVFEGNFVSKRSNSSSQGDISFLGDVTFSNNFNATTVASNSLIPRSYFDNRTICRQGQVGFMAGDQLICIDDLMCLDSKDGSQEYLVGITASGNKICNPLVMGANCAEGSSLTLRVQGDGSMTSECCEPQCNAADVQNACSGTRFTASNGCGVCTGTREAVDATYDWVDTGEVRETGLCTNNQMPTEVRQRKNCLTEAQCGGVECTAEPDRWVPSTRPCTSECVPSWPRDTSANTCVGHCVVQNDGCGNTRVIRGTSTQSSPRCMENAMGPGADCGGGGPDLCQMPADPMTIDDCCPGMRLRIQGMTGPASYPVYCPTRGQCYCERMPETSCRPNGTTIRANDYGSFSDQVAECCTPPQNECGCGGAGRRFMAVCGMPLNCSQQTSPEGGVMCFY